MLLMKKFRVTFLPDNVCTDVDAGTSILSAAALAGVEMEGPCGGGGTCGKCRVRLGDQEERPWVKACETFVTRDMVVEVAQVEVLLTRKSVSALPETKIDINPGVQKVALKIRPPSLEDQSCDARRLEEALGRGNLSFGLDALRSLPVMVREQDGLVTVVLADNLVLAVEAGDCTGRFYGLAVDIGTTTVAAALVDLRTGASLASACATNTQNIFGADVITRIEHVMNCPKGLEQLQRRVVQVVNRLAAQLASSVQASQEEIQLVAVAANTTMSHLFLGVDPRSLAPSPFIPVFTRPVLLKAGEAGLAVSPAAPLYLLPNIAGYVGGDTVAVIMATEIYQKNGVYLALDIGTNGEIVLADHGRLSACSTAAGPAFEGGRISCGMRAAAGAIEGVVIDGEVHLKVIGAISPRGICGSGLLDAVAQLVKAGIIDRGGRMLARSEAESLPPALQKRLGQIAGENCFVLATEEQTGAEAVGLTQKDVRELQLAKAAVRAGIEVLLSQAGLCCHDIDQLFLAGAFGNYLDKNSALALGLLPPAGPEKVIPVGNAAGAGAKLALFSRDIRKTACEVARRVKHVELSAEKEFFAYFVDALHF